MTGSIIYVHATIRREMLFIANSFGFENARDFLMSAFRYHDFGLVLPIMVGVGIIEGFVYMLFGLKFMELIALGVLFIFEIISGIWASRVQYNNYKALLKKDKGKLTFIEKCELRDKIDKYRFSSSKLKRAGAVMGFWLIILFVIWQFTFHNGTVSTLFNTAHLIFVSYIVSIYVVSVIENGIVISGNKEKFLPLSQSIKNLFKHQQK